VTGEIGDQLLKRGSSRNGPARKKTRKIADQSSAFLETELRKIFSDFQYIENAPNFQRLGVPWAQSVFKPEVGGIQISWVAGGANWPKMASAVDSGSL